MIPLHTLHWVQAHWYFMLVLGAVCIVLSRFVWIGKWPKL